MNFAKITRLMPAAGFVLSLALAPAAMAQTAASPMAPAGTMAPTAPAMAPAAPATTMAPPAAKAAAMLPAGEKFKTAAEAAAHCPGDTVVWASLGKSKAFHLSTSKHYGKTKHGAYACEKDALAAGLHQAKN